MNEYKPKEYRLGETHDLSLDCLNEDCFINTKKELWKRFGKVPFRRLPPTRIRDIVTSFYYYKYLCELDEYWLDKYGYDIIYIQEVTDNFFPILWKYCRMLNGRGDNSFENFCEILEYVLLYDFTFKIRGSGGSVSFDQQKDRIPRFKHLPLGFMKLSSLTINPKIEIIEDIYDFYIERIRVKGYPNN